MQQLWNLAFRISFDAAGNYTFNAPSWIKFGVPIKDFRSTGIDDQATGTVFTLTDKNMIPSVPLNCQSGLYAERGDAAQKGVGAEFYATDTQQWLKSNGATWDELAKAV